MEVKIKKVLELIRSHYEKDNNKFRNICLDIEKDCALNDCSDLGDYILALTGDTNTFCPGGGEVDGNKDLIRLSTNETFILNKIRDCRANMNEAMCSIDDNDTSRKVVKGLLEQIKELKTDLNISLKSKINKKLEG